MGGDVRGTARGGARARAGRRGCSSCNPAARVLLGPAAADGARCCDLLGCRPPGDGPAAGCVTELVLRGDGPLAERQVPLRRRRRRVAHRPSPVGERRPGRRHAPPARRAPPGWRARTCRRACACARSGARGWRPTRRRSPDEWLGHRPGQVLKYLICERGRVVPHDELLEVFWPNAGPRRRHQRAPGDPHAARPARAGPPARQGVRLRRRAHGRLRAGPRPRVDRRRRLRGARPRRARRARSAATSSAPAPRSPRRSPPTAATSWPTSPTRSGRCSSARACASWSPRCCAASRGSTQAAGDDEAAAEHLQRLAELEPLDLAVQRELIALMLRRGRHSEALRRYELVRRRYRRAFGTEPDFALADLTG